MSFTALLYHEVRDTQITTLPLKAATAYEIHLPPSLFLKQSEFKRQMTYLVENGANFLRLQDIKDYYEKGHQLPANSVLISFDDAFQSLLTHAYPVLKELNIPASLFLVSAWPFDQEQPFNQQAAQVMSWSQIDRIKDVFELANHTHDLHHLLGPGSTSVMQASAETLEADLKTCTNYLDQPACFAYPFGFYDDRLVESLKQLGVNYAFTTKSGPNDRQTPRLALNRTLIAPQLSFEAFQALVNLTKEEEA